MTTFIDYRRYGNGCTAAVLLLVLSAAGQSAYAGGKPTLHTVAIEAMKFSPQTIEVNVGDTILFKNQDPFPHTATAENRSFDSREIAANRSWKFKARKKGTYPYICTLHPTMKGVLVVK